MKEYLRIANAFLAFFLLLQVLAFSQLAHPFKQEIEKIAAPFDIYKRLSFCPSIN